MITDFPKPLLLSLCNISNIAAMYQNTHVEGAKLVDVMQREKNRAFGGTVVKIDNYSG